MPALGLLQNDVVLVEETGPEPAHEPIVVYRVFLPDLPDDLAAGCLLHLIGRGDVILSESKKPGLLGTLDRLAFKPAPEKSPRREMKKPGSRVIGSIGARRREVLP
ncbi:MAG TPA: hypothetical protein VGR09_09545 [Gemmatimonadales bacterium]|nr:hypothetical protein [Gemmatimonadales bacterium]